MYRILIVDDEKYVRKSIKARINWESLNCEVIGEADNGLSALEFLTSNTVDIMFIDIMMPKLGGFELIEQIRDTHPNLQIAIISGHDTFNFAKQAIRLQVVDFIKKPINADEMTNTIKTMIERIQTNKIKATQRHETTANSTLISGTLQMKAVNSICESPEYSMTLFSDNTIEKLGWLLIYLTPKSNEEKKIKREQRESILSLIQDFFKKEHPKVIYYISFNELLSNEIRLLIADSEVPIKELCEKIFTSIFENFSDQFSSIHATSTRKYELVKDLHASYAQTLLLLKEKIFCKQSCVINESMCQEADQKKSELIFSMLEHLRSFIKTQQFVKAERMLKKIFSKSSYLCVNTLESIILGIHNLAMEYSTLYQIDMSDFFAYQLTGRYTLLTYIDLDQLYSTLESFIYTFFFEATQFKDDDIISKIKKYIDSNLSSDLGTSEIANVFFFNPSYLSQLFKKHTHMTLSKYIEKQRIEKACTLLTNFDMLISEVADEVGYNDANYFSKVFYKIMKLTPSEFRKIKSVNNDASKSLKKQ
ncbi:MAG: response regulator transcription factor [bacterium]